MTDTSAQGVLGRVSPCHEPRGATPCLCTNKRTSNQRIHEISLKAPSPRKVSSTVSVFIMDQFPFTFSTKTILKSHTSVTIRLNHSRPHRT